MVRCGKKRNKVKRNRERKEVWPLRSDDNCKARSDALLFTAVQCDTMRNKAKECIDALNCKAIEGNATINFIKGGWFNLPPLSLYYHK